MEQNDSDIDLDLGLDISQQIALWSGDGRRYMVNLGVAWKLRAIREGLWDQQVEYRFGDIASLILEKVIEFANYNVDNLHAILPPKIETHTSYEEECKLICMDEWYLSFVGGLSDEEIILVGKASYLLGYTALYSVMYYTILRKKFTLEEFKGL